jgi:aromatic-L-amino-acid/L-tryptophan decarboxylase
VDTETFRRHGHELVDWIADYYRSVETLPVRAQVQPREVFRRLPEHPPAEGESFEAIFRDFNEIILPGMTHWQHPSFFAYFPANSSPPSVLAEMLTAALGSQCMSWVTSPAATELEERVMLWLREMIGLPGTFSGVIQDTASTSTLCAILTAREVRSGFAINTSGFPANTTYMVYCSTETHSSIEKAVKIAGIGREHLRKVEVDAANALRPGALEQAIREDLAAGRVPLAVVATLGTTGSTAVDPLAEIAAIARRFDLWLHVDAAYAGSALLLPEYRGMIEGVEGADSFVFNPHKWLFTNFDCSAYFVKDETALVRTFEILPEYLKTSEAERVNNYRDWGIQLGRRFRALKLWFVIRSYGISGLQERLREHLRMAQELAARIRESGGFQLMAPVPLNLICFRYAPGGIPETSLNGLNMELMERLNRTGRIYLTHTKLNTAVALRMVVGQTNVGQRHVDEAWELITTTARSLGG